MMMHQPLHQATATNQSSCSANTTPILANLLLHGKESSRNECFFPPMEQIGNGADDAKSDSRKRVRHTYSQLQNSVLEKIYLTKNYISREQRMVVAKSIDLTERQVKNWFQNRRMKIKKEGQLSTCNPLDSDKNGPTDMLPNLDYPQRHHYQTHSHSQNAQLESYALKAHVDVNVVKLTNSQVSTFLQTGKIKGMNKEHIPPNVNQRQQMHEANAQQYVNYPHHNHLHQLQQQQYSKYSLTMRQRLEIANAAKLWQYQQQQQQHRQHDYSTGLFASESGGRVHHKQAVCTDSVSR